jgi:maleate isomerase
MNSSTPPVTGALYGERLDIPTINVDVVSSGSVVNGAHDERFTALNPPQGGHPDVRSFQRRFGLLLPATNTIMEHELWSLLVANGVGAGIEGVGLRTTPVVTPKPDISTPEGVAEFRAGFLSGLEAAVQTALLGRPQYLIMGLSLEHILVGLEPIRETMASIRGVSDLLWATWHEAVQVALQLLGAKRIGILTPFEASGNASAIRMFNDMGIDVVASVGLACNDLRHLAHLPDWAKEQAIIEVLATPANRLDAVVQCGTGMSMLNIIDGLEARTGIPIVAINPTILWYALRENGFKGALNGAGRLLREF